MKELERLAATLGLTDDQVAEVLVAARELLADPEVRQRLVAELSRPASA